MATAVTLFTTVLSVVVVVMAVAFVGALIMLRRAHANGSADVLRDNVKTQR
jgi:hypothetical protein